VNIVGNYQNTPKFTDINLKVAPLLFANSKE